MACGKCKGGKKHMYKYKVTCDHCGSVILLEQSEMEHEYDQRSRASRPTPELAKTTEACSDFCSNGINSWVRTNGARKFTAITSSQTSTG